MDPMTSVTRYAIGIAASTVLFLAGESAFAKGPQSGDEIKNALDAAYAKAQLVTGGKNADYIPALAKVDSKIFGVAIVTVDGRVFTAGDIKSEVSIQSISKVFTAALVMEQQSPDAIKDNVGVDATGQVFNSIVAVEAHKGLEMNAMVNPGAIATTSMVKGDTRDTIWNGLLDWYGKFAGRTLRVNDEVFKSESATNQRNQAIAQLMFAYGRIKDQPARAADIYTEQCAVSVNAKDLAIMAATLANGGRNPVSGQVVMKSENVPELLAIMATAGLYDDSGKWLFKTGLPAKSGVGGGIIAVAPGKFGIAAISPPLDEAGNSVKAQAVIAEIDNALGANPYAVTPHAPLKAAAAK
jgi:glutaminase